MYWACAVVAGTHKCHGNVVRLLGEFKADANRADRIGLTPIHQAAMRDDTDVVRLLARDFKADASKADKLGRTPTCLAAYYDRHATVELLAGELSADVNEAMYNGQTPIYKAAEGGHEAMVTLLVSHGARRPALWPKWAQAARFGAAVEAGLRKRPRQLPLDPAVRDFLRSKLGEVGVVDMVAAFAQVQCLCPLRSTSSVHK